MSTKRTYRRHQINIAAIKKIVPTVQSWRALAIQLGLPYPSSYVYDYIRPICNLNGIDYSHFLGQAVNKGKSFPNKRTDIQLYLSNELSIGGHELKQRLIFEKIKEHKCEVCNRTEWNGSPIPIQLHHIDGNSVNNLLENLKIICPNCHAQTPNYCGKNCKRFVPPSERVSDDTILRLIPLSENTAQVLREIGLSLSKPHYNRIRRLMEENPSLSFKPKPKIKRDEHGDPYWRIRAKTHKRKVEWPSKEILQKLVWEKPMTILGRELGWTTEGALRKICAQYGIQCPPIRYWPRRRAGWSHEEALKPMVPKQPLKRLADDQVISILGELKSPYWGIIRKLAKNYNVTNGVIIDIREGRTYKHIPRENGGTMEPAHSNLQIENLANYSYSMIP